MQKNAAAKQQNRCHICKKIITGNSYKFNSHLYQHKAVKARFKCSVCSKEFFRSDTFSRHLEGHRGIIMLFLVEILTTYGINATGAAAILASTAPLHSPHDGPSCGGAMNDVINLNFHIFQV